MRNLISAIILLFTVLNAFTQPVNDDCANAIQLVVDAPCIAGTNIGATADGNASCGQLTTYANKSVWYSFVATGSNTKVNVTNVSGDLDVNITLYYSCGLGSFRCVNANGNNQNENVVINTVAGSTYLVRVDGSGAIWPLVGNEDGTFCIHVETNVPAPNPSGDCAGAQPFCTGTMYQFPAGTNTTSQTGPNYGCLQTQPNPAWYYMKIAQSEPIDIHLASDAGVDIDFICWGPFTSEITACQQITAGGGTIVDCSYSTAPEEDCNIATAIIGEYYMLHITNYSNQPSNIIFSHTGGSGALDCSIINSIIAQNNGPFCPGQTLQLNATDVPSATYSWSGPNGFTSAIRNPIITNVTSAITGTYNLTTVINTTTYNSSTNVVVFNSNGIECSGTSNCKIIAVATDTLLCLGENMVLSVPENIGLNVLSSTFDNGIFGVGWASNQTANFYNPACVSTPPYGTTFLWMDNTTPAPRKCETNDFNVLNGGQISFWMKFATQGFGTPCEGPDEAGEGLTLQYSTTNGASWTDITYFSPDGTQMLTNPDPNYINHAQITTGTTAFTSWNRYTFSIPIAAMTTSSRFRWIQYNSTDANTDNWGIDSVLISTTLPNSAVLWSSNPVGFNYTGAITPAVFPIQSAFYTASISNVAYSCKDSIQILILPQTTATLSGLSPSYCSNNQFVVISGTPEGGTFTGNGVTGNVFYPSNATLGNNIINYAYTDTAGCSDTAQVNVMINQTPSLIFTDVTNANCGQNNGYAYLDAAGGALPYVFKIDNTTAQTLSNLGAGMHVAQVTDNNGCSDHNNFTVQNIGGPVVSIQNIVISTCESSCDGHAEASATGASPFNYRWSNGETSAVANELCAGTNTVVVTDANGCVSTDSIHLNHSGQNGVVSGRISYSGGFINGAFADVEIYSTTHSHQGGYDHRTRMVSVGADGRYLMSGFPNDSCVIKVKLHNHANMYPHVFNTYFCDTGAVTKWDDATTVKLSCGDSTEINIVMFENQHGEGHGKINGKLVYYGNAGLFSPQPHGIFIASGKAVGNPVTGGEIYIELEPDDEPIANTETDTAGFYEFTGLPDTTYSLRVEIPGMPLVSTYTIVVNATDSIFGNLDFYVDTTDNSGFIDTALTQVPTEKNNYFEVAVYPNPFKECTEIKYKLNNESKVLLKVFDAAGKEIETLVNANQQTKGEYHYKFESKTYKSGTYFIQLMVEKTVYLKKVVRE